MAAAGQEQGKAMPGGRGPRGAEARRRKLDALYPRNDYGGIAIDPEELETTFRFFDPSGKGEITYADLQARLKPFYKALPAKELKFLLGDRGRMSLEELRELLMTNDITGFDPVAEAFRVFDPRGTGKADPDVMADVFKELGFDYLSDEDLRILKATADVDGDGQISIDDFRGMLAAAQETKPQEPGQDQGEE